VQTSLAYVVEILTQHHRSNGFPLPPVLPLVLHHALLDLTRFDPTTGETDPRMQVILQLMKLARQKNLLRFFKWLAGFPAHELPESLLGKMLLYALYSDSDLDAQAIYSSLSTDSVLQKSTMSVAEKLIAEGREKGFSIGLWIGRIQALQQFLGRPMSAREDLETLELAELESRYAWLRRELISAGMWIGRIEALQEFLGQAVSPYEELEILGLAELQSRHASLHREYDARFKC